MSTEKILEIYYDHYKDTFTYLRGYLSSRDKIFYITLGLLVLVFFQTNNPDVTKDISINIIKKNADDNVSIDINFINSLLLFIFLSLIIKYFQLNLLIERQYKYLHSLEDKLTTTLGVKITREGKSYVDGRPFVLNVIRRIYETLFPVLLLLVLIKKFSAELILFEGNLKSWYFIFDTCILAFILIITVMYILRKKLSNFKRVEKSETAEAIEIPQ